MIELRPTTQEDLDYVQNNPYEDAVKKYPHFEVPTENCFTAIFKGNVIAVGGTVVVEKGIAEFWLMLVSDFKDSGLHSIELISTIKEKLDELIEQNNIIRAQAIIRTDFSKAIKMIEFLGFKREVLLMEYTPDKCDVYMYAKIRRLN